MNERIVTHGQVLLAKNYANDLGWELTMASCQKEGEPCREEHIREARAKLDRLNDLLSRLEKQEAA